MNRSRMASALALATAGALAVVFGCSKNDKTPLAPGGNDSTFTITATAGAGGSIVPSGAVVVHRDSSKTFHVAADAGLSIVSVLVDNVNVGADSVYTFNSVTANHTIAATFSGGVAEVFDSGVLGSGGSYKHVFPNAGSSPYYCQLHPTLMTGTVNVSAAGSDSAVVTVSNFSFSPATVTIKPGGYVRWAFNSTHTATSGTPPVNGTAMKMPHM
ncbi:MAG TPA: hypothetical protein VFK69_03615 [Candidatus Eisenbacteria bacterium]|nr:hypothetical protein [Candidatus Eisenbacteria bacterium]